MEIKISTASPGDAPVAIPDENNESPTTSSPQASSTHQLQAPLINPDWALEALDDDPQPPTPTSMEDEFAPPAPKSPPKVIADSVLQHLPPKIDTLLIDFRRCATPSIDDVFPAFSLHCEKGRIYTSLTTIVSAFPNNEMFDNTINKIRQYVSQKLLILVDKKASDSYLRLLKTRHFVVGGFATYFSAKQSFVIFEHASNAGALCIGLRAPQ